jgi:hypothetical protein
MVSPRELYETIPEEVWTMAVLSCRGYSEGQAAKLAGPNTMFLSSWPLMEHEFADLETAKLRVACVLKFYDHLTQQVAHHFEDLMDICFNAAENLASVHLDALPLYCRPLSPFFSFSKNRPGDFGEYLFDCYLPLAKSFSRRIMNASWAHLDTTARVECLRRMNSEQRDTDEKRCAEFRPKSQQVCGAIC